MTVKEFLIHTYEIVDLGRGKFQTRRPHVMCNDGLIEEYREGNIYHYVPIELVEKLIEKHGGFMKVMTRCESIDMVRANNDLLKSATE